MTDEMPQELRDRLHGLSAGAAELNQLAESKYDRARQSRLRADDLYARAELADSLRDVSRLKADDLYARAEGERAFAQMLERDGNDFRERAKRLQIAQVELIAEWEQSRTTIN